MTNIYFDLSTNPPSQDGSLATQLSPIVAINTKILALISLTIFTDETDGVSIFKNVHFRLEKRPSNRIKSDFL